MKIKSLQAAVGEHGLILRGGFAVDTVADTVTDTVTDTVHGRATRSVVLVGNAGSVMWEVFSQSTEYRDGKSDPLNRWTVRIGDALAAQLSARAVFPFGEPHHPFLRWGKKAEALHNSHLGMLIHPRYGLWHAYRFALLFADEVPMSPTPRFRGGRLTGKNVCASCTTKPCRPACPVNAFGDDGYDVGACHRYLDANPDSACMRSGCAARAACPQGDGYRYAPSHAAFHMQAFVVAMARGEFSSR